MNTSRRPFLRSTLAISAGTALGLRPSSAKKTAFKLKYIVSSAMYGTFKVADILPEVRKTGASHIDLWPRPHGNQREQVSEMGDEAFKSLLNQNQVKLGVSTCYKLGPFGLQKEMRWAKQLTGEGVVLICAGRGPRNATGDELKAAVKAFVEKMKPHLEVAEETGCTIGIENHKNNIISSPDSIKYLVEFSAAMPRLGLAFAPHHLPQDGTMQGALIRQLGDGIKFFYAQQFGTGSHHKQPREKELLQMPGRGPLDFNPLVQALMTIGYSGFTEIFMHPYPRGLPIQDTAPEITAEINRSREYLDGFV